MKFYVTGKSTEGVHYGTLANFVYNSGTLFTASIDLAKENNWV